MKKYFLILLLLLFAGACYATPVTITPVKKISTTTKKFREGNQYQFKDVNSDDIYTGTVTYYRENGMLGQEAQIEISNFTNQKGEKVSGKITIIPQNHKNFQEFANYFSLVCCDFIRGSEIILKPNIHTFVINSTSQNGKENVAVTLKPANEISTASDEIEIGDKIKFIVVSDIYKNGKLFINSGTSVIGIVDYLEENGWCADNAAIYFKTFLFKDVAGRKQTINTDLKIDGFEILKYKSNRVKQFFNYSSTFVRGKEVDIKNYDKNIRFVIFL